MDCIPLWFEIEDASINMQQIYLCVLFLSFGYQS